MAPVKWLFSLTKWWYRTKVLDKEKNIFLFYCPENLRFLCLNLTKNEVYTLESIVEEVAFLGQLSCQHFGKTLKTQCNGNFWEQNLILHEFSKKSKTISQKGQFKPNSVFWTNKTSETEIRKAENKIVLSQYRMGIWRTARNHPWRVPVFRKNPEKLSRLVVRVPLEQEFLHQNMTSVFCGNILLCFSDI